MKKPLFVLTAALVAGSALLPAGAAGQGISLELRGSLQKPMGSFDDVADGNAGYGAAAFFNVSPNLSLYGGWAKESFGCQGGCENAGYESEGFEGGVKFIVTRVGGVQPWLKGGPVYHRFEVESGNDDGPEDDDLDIVSDRALGFQIGVGADIPLGMVLSFSPALRYQKYSAEFPIIEGVATAERDVGFLALDLGAHIHFGR